MLSRKQKSYRVDFSELAKAAAGDIDAWHALCRYNELRNAGVTEPEIRYSVAGGYSARDPHAIRGTR